MAIVGIKKMNSIIDDLKMHYKFGGMAQRLIYWNIACFLVSLVFFYQFKVGAFDFPNWISLSSEPSNFISKPWTLLTYAFFHDGFGHIFFNMIVLNFSSTLFLTFFNQKQLLGLYILSAIFAGIVFVVRRGLKSFCKQKRHYHYHSLWDSCRNPIRNPLAYLI